MDRSETLPAARAQRRSTVVWAGLLVVVAIVLLIVFGKRWLPLASSILTDRSGTRSPAAGEPHDHGHDHDEGDAITLSPQARKNIALTTGSVKLRDFERTISVPGVLVERPGQSIVQITAPMTGMVTRIGVIQGEAVTPGQFLFELRLTHEDLVQAQSEFLKTAEELDVIAREVERLERGTASGAVAGKSLLERKYEQQKQQAALHAQHQALLLHGLSEEQVNNIRTHRTLLKYLEITVPASDGMLRENVVYQVQELKVDKGQQVVAGETLAELTEHSELFLEGSAFEKDVPLIHEAVERDAAVTAVMESAGKEREMIEGLKILYLAGSVDVASRAFHFYVPLENELLRDRTADGHRFVSWRYKPGQRAQVLIPVETWKDRIVLPADAVAQDGVETYVFLMDGDRFIRQPVHVEHRDPYWVVIANDGSVYPGSVVAMSAAQQILLALKNKSGGAIDPHAGHSH